MSRAYCLTCNEKVHETPSGTCPLGHPVAAEDRGPEPWVGFAGDTDVAAVPMQHLDAAGRPREHVVVGHRTNGQHHVNGSANGQASPLAPHETTPPTNGTGHTPSPDTAPPPSIDDDLTALLADALRDNAPQEPATGHEPPVDPGATDAPAATEDADDDTDWGELASLAAQLHLDEDTATDDGPAARTDERPDELPAADEPSDELSAANVDDLLAELTGDAPTSEPDVANTTPPPLDPAPFDAAAREPAPPPPPPAPRVEDTSIWDEPAAAEDVRSAPAADPADIWAEPDEVPAVDTPPATTVDLYNFTARGKRVGDAGADRPARKKRGRKR